MVAGMVVVKSTGMHGERDGDRGTDAGGARRWGCWCVDRRGTCGAAVCAAYEAGGGKRRGEAGAGAQVAVAVAATERWAADRVGEGL